MATNLVEKDILNYAYIWYNNDYSPIEEKEQDIIYKLIDDYTYPNYFKNNNITLDEKEEILKNELSFVQKKRLEYKLNNIVIIQIPRILYDLFNIYYYYQNNLNFFYKFNYNCEILVKYEDYCKYTNKLLLDIKNNIFELNLFIVDFLITNKYIDNIQTYYITILEALVIKINEFKNNIEHKFNQNQTIILKQVLEFENQYNSGMIILYRGADVSKDNITIYLPDGTLYTYVSLSLNMSMLSECIGDYDSCTLNYVTPRDFNPINYRTYNKKIKYNIKKHFHNDLSDESEMFFIPPIHPFIQMYCSGEINHPRTKMGKNLVYGPRPLLKGIIMCPKEFYIENDYLKSNKTIEELQKLYLQFKEEEHITTWEKKYLKYKKKYLRLKNQLN